MKKQDRVYHKRHEMVRAIRGLAKNQSCCQCGNKAREWAQIKGTKGDNAEDYQPMCCSCHQRYDDHWSEESKAKISRWSINKWAGYSSEEIAKLGRRISAGKMGHEVTAETRDKIRKAKLGVKIGPTGKRTPEQCERIRQGRWDNRKGGDAT